MYHHADCICWDLGLHQHGGVSNTYEIMYRYHNSYMLNLLLPTPRSKTLMVINKYG